MWAIAEVVESILVYLVRSPSFSPMLLYCQRDLTNPWEGRRLPSQLLVCRLWYVIGRKLDFTTYQWTIQNIDTQLREQVMSAHRVVYSWRIPWLQETLLLALKSLGEATTALHGSRNSIKELYFAPHQDLRAAGKAHNLRRDLPFLSTALEHAPHLLTNLTLLSLTSCINEGLDFSLLFPSETIQRPRHLHNLRHLLLEDIHIAFPPNWKTDIEPPPLQSFSLSRVYIPDNLLEPFFDLFCTPSLERFRYIKHQFDSSCQQFPDIPGIPHKVLENLAECCPRLESVEVLLDRESLPIEKILPHAFSTLHKLFPSASLIGINFRSVIETSVYHFDAWMTRLDVQTSIGDQHLSLSLVHVFLCSGHAANLTHLKLPPAFIPVEWFDPEDASTHMHWACSHLRSLDIGIRDDHPSKTKARHSRNVFGFIVTHFQRLEVLRIHRPLMSDSVNNGMCFLSRLPHLESFTLWTDSFSLPIEPSVVSSPVASSSSMPDLLSPPSSNKSPRRQSSFSSLRSKLLPTRDRLRDVRWMSLNPTSADIRKGLSSLAYCRRVAKLDLRHGHFGRSLEAKALLWAEHTHTDTPGPPDATFATVDGKHSLKEGSLWKDIHWFIIACRTLSGKHNAEEYTKAMASSALVPGIRIIITAIGEHVQY